MIKGNELEIISPEFWKCVNTLTPNERGLQLKMATRCIHWLFFFAIKFRKSWLKLQRFVKKLVQNNSSKGIFFMWTLSPGIIYVFSDPTAYIVEICFIFS